ncbi:NTP transferase domain-containing protein [Niabella sp. CC-SYL272]|uniref:NTP transferase domain-containing protein n=1 Tax=Niabella agricola TaxID=2891571 RepID=UPI001F33CA4B|nr:NTP transferase domain-containing protein [Niabella agricola]MCF3110654.1 NTP transferase domain-containing protein [Niabella agricola]
MILNVHKLPALNGLVLAGGKSRRMGTAKDLIQWHGKEQRYYTADLLHHCCDEVFISCRQEQEKEINTAYKALPDSFLNMGPLGGILSAFRSQPDKAWLVVACDLPLVNKKTLEHLIKNRADTKIATAYESPVDGLPEPLITIWEPASYPVLLNFLGQGITCPRKVLIQNKALLLKPLQPETLMNVNTPEEAVTVKEMIDNGKQ